MPLLIRQLLGGPAPLEKPMLVITSPLASRGHLLSPLILFLISRYWSITSPLRYLRRRTKKRALVMIGLAWLASSTWVLPVLAWHHVEFGGVRQSQVTQCTDLNK